MIVHVETKLKGKHSGTYPHPQHTSLDVSQISTDFSINESQKDARAQCSVEAYIANPKPSYGRHHNSTSLVHETSSIPVHSAVRRPPAQYRREPATPSVP